MEDETRQVFKTWRV